MTTFIVRLNTDPEGHVTGVVERVRTGHKERFDGYDALAPLLERLARSDGFAPIPPPTGETK